jgi:ABC-2 type transport system ATP-binding protein
VTTSTKETSAPTLVANALTKKIGDRTIVDAISFTLQPGEVFGFLGPNGAGKTTTIRMLVGLIKPTSGTISVCGRDIRKQFEEAMRCIGCIVENPDLYRFMTGRENLEHFARMIGVGRDDIERVASIVSLHDRLGDRVSTYSLGMRQRLGIAQALLGDPRLLILDEPANGLDPAGIREMRELLRRLAAEGLTVFVSSHLLAEIELMCDRVAIIHRGRLLQTGPVRDLVSTGREYELRTADPTRAAAVAAARGLTARLDGERLFVPLDEEQIPPFVDALVAEHIGVYQLQPRARTLEELFLEATGGETVG